MNCSRVTTFNSMAVYCCIMVAMASFFHNMGPLHVLAQSSSSDCNPGMLQQLSACGPYVTSTSAPGGAGPDGSVQPSAECCASLQTVDLDCMCTVLSGPSIPNLDRDKALSLPQACNLPAAGSCSSG